MKQNLSSRKTRLNIPISSELKEKLVKYADKRGAKISVLVRESIEEKLQRIEKKILEDRMKSAYVELSEENRRICDDFRYADAENL